MPQPGDLYRIASPTLHFKPNLKLEVGDLVEFVGKEDDLWIVELLERNREKVTNQSRRPVKPETCRKEYSRPGRKPNEATTVCDGGSTPTGHPPGPTAQAGGLAQPDTGSARVTPRPPQAQPNSANRIVVAPSATSCSTGITTADVQVTCTSAPSNAAGKFPARSTPTGGQGNGGHSTGRTAQAGGLARQDTGSAHAAPRPPQAQPNSANRIAVAPSATAGSTGITTADVQVTCTSVPSNAAGKFPARSTPTGGQGNGGHPPGPTVQAGGLAQQDTGSARAAPRPPQAQPNSANRIAVAPSATAGSTGITMADVQVTCTSVPSNAADSKSGSNSTPPQTHQGEGQSIQANPLATLSTQSAAPEPSIGVRQIEQQIPQTTTTNSMCEWCEETPAIWSCQHCASAPVLCQSCDSKLHKKEAKAKHIRQLLSPRADSGFQDQQATSQAARTQLSEPAETPAMRQTSHIPSESLIGPTARERAALAEPSTGRQLPANLSNQDRTRQAVVHAEPTISLQELLKQSIPRAPFKMVQLMTLNIDVQDAGSFNQKTLVSKEAVRKILAQREHHLRHWLRSDSLKGQSITTIGLYGNIALIRDWLRNIHVLSEPEASHLVNDSESGILCISNGTKVQFLVLIPPPHSFEDVTSTNRCCNLVRYLQELSDNMVTFFAESELKMFSSTPFGFTNVQRTITRKVERHEGSDEIYSTPGFTLRLDSKSVKEPASVSDIRLCHSSGICCFHVAMHVAKGRRKLSVDTLRERSVDAISQFWSLKSSKCSITFCPDIEDEKIIKLWELVQPSLPEVKEYRTKLDDLTAGLRHETEAQWQADQELCRPHCEEAVAHLIKAWCRIAQYFFPDLVDGTAEEFKCSKCQHQVTNPVRLKCHYFCGQCLTSPGSNTSIKCPTCGQFSLVSDGTGRKLGASCSTATVKALSLKDESSLQFVESKLKSSHTNVTAVLESSIMKLNTMARAYIAFCTAQRANLTAPDDNASKVVCQASGKNGDELTDRFESRVTSSGKWQKVVSFVATTFSTKPATTMALDSWAQSILAEERRFQQTPGQLEVSDAKAILKIVHEFRRAMVNKLLNKSTPQPNTATRSGQCPKMKRLMSATADSLRDHYLKTSCTEQMEVLELKITDASRPTITMAVRKEDDQVVKYVEQLYKYHPLNPELQKMTPSPSHVPTVDVHPSKNNIPLVPGKHNLLRVYNLRKGMVLAIVCEVGANQQESTAIHILPERDYVDSDNLKTSPFAVKGQVSLVDFNETSRLVAFCVTGKQQQVRVYKFQGDWKQWNEYCTMDLRAGAGRVSLPVQDLLILPVRDEDDQEKLCVIDRKQKGTIFNMRSNSKSGGPFRIGRPVEAALATLDGVFLLTFSTAGNSITLHAYSVESREEVSSFPLDSDQFPASCVKTLRVVRFEHNMFLVGFNQKKESISSVVLHILSERGGVRVVDGASKPPTSPTAAVKRVPNYLDYLYYGYEKFCLSPCLPTGELKVFLHCVLADSTQQMDIMTPQDYLSELFNNLQKRTCKNVQRAYPFQEMVQVTRSSGSADLRLGQKSIPVTDWLRRLICLVPIQIGRAESGVFKILANGINTGEVIGKDTLDVIDKIEFGLYEGVLKDWTGPVKVLTSMGKQSAGKSYMLNHLTGSLFDASGGRCTDGIWMTIQQTDDCLYVVLDFEGLGSMERGDQEDVLLSVVNAAISGLTIFKVDNRFDTDIEETLKRIQTGVDWIREDISSDKLLRGSIIFNIKDVAADGVPDVQYQFDKMISSMCQGDPNNFVTKMYKERYSIQAVPTFRTDEYQRELSKIGHWLRGVETPIFQSGCDFAEIMKMLMAKVHHQDWLPFDQTIVQIRVERIKRQLDLAIERGQGSINSEPGSLSLASGESVADEDITAAGGLIFPGLRDEGLCLPTGAATEKSWTSPLAHLAKEFSSVFGKKRNGGDLDHAKEWTNGLQAFLHAVVGRRKERIKKWQESYFRPKENSKFVVGLRRDIDTGMENMEKQLELCRDLECHHCHYPCLLPKYHTSPHSCFGNHRCYIACYHCCGTAEGMLEEPKGSTPWPDVNEQEGMTSLRLALDTASVFPIHDPKGRIDGSWQCREVAGHADKHNCKIRKHTCGKECHLIKWDKCAKTCKHPREHNASQPHVCTSENHICVGVCELDGCTARCTVSYTGESHRHFCGVNRCQKECDFPGCKEKCKDQDHFHGTNGPAVQHFCTKPYHVCVKECSQEGLCMVMDEGKLEQTKGSKTKTAHTGQVITYDWYQTYNGAKIQCRVRIKSGYTSHKGPHDCKQPRHTCTRTCANCGYYCKERIGHRGRCIVPHGNMRHTKAIIPGGGTFRVGGHEFTESDTGESEVCNLYCLRMGRGHTHFRFCEEAEGKSKCGGDVPGIRHVDQRIGPEESRPKDECTHEAFWREQDIADPCPNGDFNKCPYPCRLPAPHGRETTSYCSLPLWHPDVTGDEVRNATAGYFDNGHHLMCEHVGYEPIHHILVLDQSPSMLSDDHKPDIDSEYYSSHPNRLGAVLDASLHYLQARRHFGAKDIVSAVGFNDEAVEIFSGQRLDPESLVKLLAEKLAPSGWTDYSKAIDLADVLLKRNEACDTIMRNAVIIFLSDGQYNMHKEETVPLLEQLLQGRSDRKKSPVRLHTVMFGKDKDGIDLLEEMADKAKSRHSHHFSMQSSFEHKINSIELMVHFEEIAAKLNRAGFMPVFE